MKAIQIFLKVIYLIDIQIYARIHKNGLHDYVLLKD